MAPATAITLYSTLALLCTTAFLNVGGASPVLDPVSSTQHLLQPEPELELKPDHQDPASYPLHPITDSPSLSPPFSSSSSSEEEEEAYKAPSWFESTLLARRLLALSPTGTASTIFPSPLPANSRAYAHIPADVAGHSISLTEYLSDCEHVLSPATSSSSTEGESEDESEGNPIFLALTIATTFRNTAHGSNLSLSLSWWDHVNRTEPVFPGFPLSPAGLPRVTLLGYVEAIDFEAVARSTGRAEGAGEVEARLTECYLRAHPDAKAWLPGRKGAPHESFWARLVVEQVYWVGGFGGLQQIGWANLSEWRGIGRWGSAGNLGDGSRRGWEGVRLPGEDE